MPDYIYMARQPIFDTEKKVVAYELLFRSSEENLFTASDGDAASSSVITNSYMLIGMSNVTKGKRGFINITENILMSDYVSMFPGENIVVEILETIDPKPEVYEACRKLKEKGYVLALDDFVFDERWRPFFDLVDIIKVDFLLTQGFEREAIMTQVNNPNVRYLAEKVETIEDFEYARKVGYSLFQGYFFSKPHIIQAREIPTNKMSYLMLLQEIYKPETDFRAMEEIIKRDTSLTFRLLKFINSAQMGIRLKIDSIRQALTLLGTVEIRKWISLVALTVIGKDKPTELLNVAIIRARICERIANYMHLHKESDRYYLLGMMSLIDALLDRPMNEIVHDLGLGPEIEATLTGQPSQLRTVLDIAVAYEMGDWNRVTQLSNVLNLDERFVAECYYEAVQWANESFGQMLES
jgi:EAL and modified HD-GYP domain-containing signal transduction protein